MAEAERVVVEVLAKMDGFDGKVRQSATAFGDGMKRIESSATQAEKAVGRSMATVERSMNAARQSSRNLGYQISDISTQLSAGSSPFLVLAQQGPQVANALDGAKGAVGRFATYLSGPMGAAILGAVTLMGVFLTKNKDTSDSVDDLVDKLAAQAEKTDLSREAQEAFGNTLAGVKAALDDNWDALKKLNLVQDTAAESAYAMAEAERQKALNIRASTVALLEHAKAQYAAARSQTFGAAGGAGAGAAHSIYAGAVSDLDAMLDKANKALEFAEKQVVVAKANLTVEGARASKVDEINSKYDKAIDKAKARAIAEGKVGKELEKQVRLYEDQRAADLKREQERNRKPRDTSGQFTLADARGIVAGLGGTVTSTTGGKHVPNSYHYRSQAVDFVPKGGMGSLTKQDIREAFEKGGAKIVELLGPGDKGHSDHFHVAFAKGKQGPDQIAAAQERAAQVEAARQDRQSSILGSLQERYAAALAKLAEGTEESADARKAAIETERVNLDAKLDADKKLDTNVRVEAKRLNDATAALAKQIIDRAEAERKFREDEAARQRELTVAEALNQQQQDALQLQEGLARTQAERRDIELKILDLAIQEERLRAQAIIAERDRLRARAAQLGYDKLSPQDREALANAEAGATIAQGTLSALPGKQAMQTSSIMQQTAGPLEQLFNSLPQSAQEISEAFEAIAAHGLDSLADAITDVITGSKSLGEAFRGVAQSIIRDIIAMTVKMLIFRAISGALGGFSGGGSAGSISSGAGAFGAAIAKAGGGHISGPGTGTSDSIPAWLSNGEFVIKSKSAKRLGLPFLKAINEGRLPHFSEGGLVRSIAPNNMQARAAGGGMTVQQYFTLDARHGITTPELLRSVNTAITEKAGQAGKMAFDASRRALPKQIGTFQKLGTT